MEAAAVIGAVKLPGNWDNGSELETTVRRGVVVSTIMHATPSDMRAESVQTGELGEVKVRPQSPAVYLPLGIDSLSTATLRVTLTKR